MNGDVLREFFHRSREWSRAKRGLELFQMAATDLRELADADTGFFVYRRRVLTNVVTPQKAAVYFPWGAFANNTDQLQDLVEEVVPNFHTLTPFMEKWSLAEDAPQQLQQQWSTYGLLEFGIWPLISREETIGSIVVARTHAASDRLTLVTRMALLDACAAQVSLALDLILTSRIAEDASQRDLLTGVFNRRGLESKLPELLAETRELGKFLVFGLIDLNDLKSINDTKGHPAGDRALQEVAQIISRHVRSEDLVARFGGDEFAVAIQSEEEAAGDFMTRLQLAIEQESDGYTASVGGALWDVDGDSMDACYRIADERLYACKRGNKF